MRGRDDGDSERRARLVFLRDNRGGCGTQQQQTATKRTEERESGGERALQVQLAPRSREEREEKSVGGGGRAVEREMEDGMAAEQGGSSVVTMGRRAV